MVRKIFCENEEERRKGGNGASLACGKDFRIQLKRVELECEV
jgi:hypothetical protein